jgi:hypothetical protein
MKAESMGIFIVAMIVIVIILIGAYVFLFPNVPPLLIKNMTPSTILVNATVLTQSQNIKIGINNSNGYNSSLVYVQGTCANNTNTFTNFKSNSFAVNTNTKTYSVNAISSFNYLTYPHIAYQCVALIYDTNKGNALVSKGFVYTLKAS